MGKPVIHILALVLVSLTFTAQIRVVKPVKTRPLTTRLTFFGGLANSVLMLERNIHDDNEALGYQVGMSYGFSKLLRGSFEYVHYKKIDINPTWFDIKARTFEFNLHWLAKFKSSHTYFYPLTGVSYNLFNGFFTGQNDYLNVAGRYKRNEYAISRWLGVNAGLGMEHFVKPFSIFAEFKMRIGLTESRFVSIMDVYFGAGIRYNIIVPSLHQTFRGTRSRYLLKSPKNDM